MYITAKVTPDRLVGEHKVNLSANDILKFAADGTIAQVVIDNIFQSLENERSTISLITKICKKLDLNVDKAVIDNAVYYLEIRHKLVHTDGFADAEFKASHALPILDVSRESEVIETNSAFISNPAIKAHYINFIKNREIGIEFNIIRFFFAVYNAGVIFFININIDIF